jgi:hypothetical protein
MRSFRYATMRPNRGSTSTASARSSVSYSSAVRSKAIRAWRRQERPIPHAVIETFTDITVEAP